MHLVILGLGSNIQPQQHLTCAIQRLQQHFPQLALSPIYETYAVGFSGPNFWNLVAGINTELKISELSILLREIETAVGRPPGAQKWADRCIDIDILMYGNWCGPSDVGLLPRADMLRYTHVLAPLAELYPFVCHAETGQTFAEHWQQFAGDKAAILARISCDVLLSRGGFSKI